MVEADLSLVSSWLAEKHLQRWWRDPSAPARVEEKYLPRLRGAEPTEMFTIVWRGEPVGFAQRYRLRDHPAWERTLQQATGEVFGEADAVSGVLLYRLLTFWLPILPGYLSYLALQHADRL